MSTSLDSLMRGIVFTAAALLATTPVKAGALPQRCDLPGVGKAVCLNSPQGRGLIERSRYRDSFWALSETFTTQQTQTLCGVASSVTVLNALPIPKPTAPELYPYAYFTQTNFFSQAVSDDVPLTQVQREGLTLDQLHQLLGHYPLATTRTYGTKSSTEEFRAMLKANLAGTTTFVIVNFDRQTVGQGANEGHFSPVAAYHEGSDRVLLLDVARYKFTPSWLPVDALFTATRGIDPNSDLSRGWLEVAALPTQESILTKPGKK